MQIRNVGHLLKIALLIWFLCACDADVVSDKPSVQAKSVNASITTAPFGSWVSPLSAESLFEGNNSVSYLSFMEGALYFVENQAAQNGRSILLKMDSEHQIHQITPGELSVRTRVHEYGGMPYLVQGQNVFYSRFKDQKIYRKTGRGEALALTPDGLRFMDCVAEYIRSQLICVREDHRGDGEAINTLVSVDMKEGGAGKVLFEGTDFVTSPVVSNNGGRAAFITWSHPNMPWDDTQLRVAKLNPDGLTESVREITSRSFAAGASIRRPSYGEDGVLYFIADWSNWWTLYRVNEDGEPELVLDKNIEIRSYALENERSALIAYDSAGMSHLARVNLVTGMLTGLGPVFSSLGWLTKAGEGAYFVGSTPLTGSEIYYLEGDQLDVVYRPNESSVPDKFRSEPQTITFATGEDEKAYGYFYPPQNGNYSGPDNQLPPLLVKVHGGPVGATNSSFNMGTQFWTSRGFAVFDINHRGSTGYGRAFRKKLYPNWGLVDIEDVSKGVSWLVQQGMVDGSKTAIRGGSAGGYTVLASLAFRDIFRAGTSYFGISDLEMLARDTHKYESRYLDQLIGSYPEAKEVYAARSPIHRVGNITAPLLLLQGLDDKVVPPNQSEKIFEALKANCIPSAYIAFEGEGHGFRKPANNVKALNSELDFYGQVFGFKPAGDVNRVNLITCN